MKVIIAMMALALAGITAHADNDMYKLEKLDVLHTCKMDAEIESAKKALNYMIDFSEWNIKNQIEVLHPEFAIWHGSWTYLAQVTPEDKRSLLPKGIGIVKADDKRTLKQAYIETLADIAFTNRVNEYIVVPNRLECVGDDMIIVSNMFSGTSVLRDSEGYIMYEAAIKETPFRFIFTFKDGKLYRSLTDIEDTVTLDVLTRLKSKVINKEPRLPKDETTRQTKQEILTKFYKLAE